MVVVVNKGMFGGSVYSTRGGRQARYVGKVQRTMAEIEIAKARGGQKINARQWRPSMVAPFLPEKITEPYHPGGNSLCYLIQTAHLMGCDPIYLLGFTLESGTPYHFGRTNPVTRRSSFWDLEPPMAWLRWYEERYPGRVRVCAGWSGPIYEVFQLERFDEDRASQRHEPEQEGGDVHGEERFRHAQPGQPVHEDGKQPGEAPSVREEGQGGWWC